MLIETFQAGPLGCNCSLLIDPATKQAIVVDPGGDVDVIQGRLERHGATIAAIVHTHTHIDHVGATAPLQRWSGAPARIHEADRFLYQMLPVQSALVGCALPQKAEIDGDLRDDITVRAGGLDLQVLHTPGHTPGSVCFVLRAAERSIVFAGDTLFRRSIGRTDLWGGDSDLIQRSIRDRLYALDEDTQVVTGHGPATTIGEERRQNPFVRAR
ncbi:MBL fold metallo-hydrolase [Chondromyces crocatus]|uniref:MBL fold metallo-hydrolase n=1 Tax=Chondromyces crocatus TaxID=52 RepID=UPI0009EA9E42|nr:MBL fold metallo-hydrolase [Chondromyces crocatus]